MWRRFTQTRTAISRNSTRGPGGRPAVSRSKQRSSAPPCSPSPSVFPSMNFAAWRRPQSTRPTTSQPTRSSSLSKRARPRIARSSRGSSCARSRCPSSRSGSRKSRPSSPRATRSHWRGTTGRRRATVVAPSVGPRRIASAIAANGDRLGAAAEEFGRLASLGPAELRDMSLDVRERPPAPGEEATGPSRIASVIATYDDQKKEEA